MTTVTQLSRHRARKAIDRLVASGYLVRYGDGKIIERERLGEQATLRLYRCTSVPSEWPHRRSMWAGVRVAWFVSSRAKPLAAWRVLLDGNYEDPYAQSLADELFTADEAAALARYLKDAHDTELAITEEPLPMATVSPDGNGLMGASAIPVGGPCDNYSLYRHDDYDLPIEVSGYYHMDQDPAPLRLVEAGTGEWVPADPPESYSYPGYDFVIEARGSGGSR